ncbi:MAG: 50S ribosomal protein L11 methyltransferase, partial [Streptosporangiaceae bacterium]
LALARYVLEAPAVVAGRTVLDLASGSGLVAIAACRAGAAHVTASEVDPYAAAAIEANAAANGVRISAVCEDLLDRTGTGFEVILAGDVFYDRALARRVLPFLASAAAEGALVLVGDPGRRYLPRGGYTAMARYDVPVSGALEDAPVKRTTVWQVPVPVQR